MSPLLSPSKSYRNKRRNSLLMHQICLFVPRSQWRKSPGPGPSWLISQTFFWSLPRQVRRNCACPAQAGHTDQSEINRTPKGTVLASSLVVKPRVTGVARPLAARWRANSNNNELPLQRGDRPHTRLTARRRQSPRRNHVVAEPAASAQRVDWWEHLGSPDPRYAV